MPQVFKDFFSDMKLGIFLTVHLKNAVIDLLFKNFKNFRSCLNCPSPYIMSLFCDLFLPREDDTQWYFGMKLVKNVQYLILTLSPISDERLEPICQ